MSSVTRTTALAWLRRRRRLLGLCMTAVIAVSLAAMVGQCLTAAAMPHGAGGHAARYSTMPADMPCAACTAGRDSGAFAEAATGLPVNLKPGLVLAFVVVSALLAFNLPKSLPIPPLPRLPKRPRTLKFCVLRI